MIPIVYHPADVLREQAASVSEITDELRILVASMFEAMDEARGIGLAGPQVGRLDRLFVVRLRDDEPRAFINPSLVAVSPDEVVYEEGCLSIPGVYADVSRPAEVTVEAFDENGDPFRLDAEGMLARVILHEYDHLDGKLFIDYFTRRRQDRLLRTYRPPIGSHPE